MENQLLSSIVLDIRNIMETAHRNVAQEVNNELIVAYWKIGEIIVRYEQNDNIRAAYGKQTLKQLSKIFQKAKIQNKLLSHKYAYCSAPYPYSSFQIVCFRLHLRFHK